MEVEVKRIVERYTDKSGKDWIRIKYMDAARTEVIIPESEYIKRSGNSD